jgi:hypothetical protein
MVEYMPSTYRYKYSTEIFKFFGYPKRKIYLEKMDQQQQQQSAQQDEISVAEIIALGASFLQLPYEARCNAYKQIGVILSQPISNWSRWIFPEQIPVELYASKEISADVESVYWFENMFSVYLASEIPDFLHLGTPIM